MPAIDPRTRQKNLAFFCLLLLLVVVFFCLTLVKLSHR